MTVLEKGRKIKEAISIKKLKWTEPSHKTNANTVCNNDPEFAPLNSTGVGADGGAGC